MALRSRTPRPHPDRRALEGRGWRTLLDYREDHIRDADGLLLVVLPRWTAEAERECGRVIASACAQSPDEAWRQLRRAVRVAERRPPVPAAAAI